ncbi:aldehyde dehydrogenase (NADP(+)) [Mucilaginibacter terrae]|uniref:Alpha-ketoglutaric semialdehyde dehydrogenase n=1 Tax=Mucilaginibacter terrae TaxID=1955052 RepID=A0ABU3H2H3_9SPHI|nr:aldehyde dehydrogenase (NADP(+)) [Mucilaginibacter terrae]MDT3405457.1 alpha-ketoglutaric semialdehyde dehydrogenase [Mucilaginibacter terrae]
MIAINIEGKQLIAGRAVATGNHGDAGADRILGKPLPFKYYQATKGEIDEAVIAAKQSFPAFRSKSGKERADLLDEIATEITAIGDDLILLANLETALPEQRLMGERQRTLDQIKAFAGLLREGSWVNATIEHGDPDRTPLPKPDLRSMQTALGPVAVFGASNFPFAFSVAGGDTISALAAGCPVVFKAHPAHPGTCELVGKAIVEAVKKCNMPDGVFSMLHGDGPTVGAELVVHPGIKAVAFTGSYKAGRAIYNAAAARPEPIPVYAEMGSTNPVFVLPEAMKLKGESIARGFAAALTLGVGQFCTNPGLLVYHSDWAGWPFKEKLAEAISSSQGGTMLTEQIAGSYQAGIVSRGDTPGLETLAKGLPATNSAYQTPVLFHADANLLMQTPHLEEELFGPSAIAVAAKSREELLSLAENLSGHLTATVHGTDEDLAAYKDLLDVLVRKVGRLIINGFPTGVEVSHAMVHGGPFPATTDARSTSVGTAAIFRFTRPVCFQGMPQALLPDELKDNNPMGIWQTVNGKLTRSII